MSTVLLTIDIQTTILISYSCKISSFYYQYNKTSFVLYDIVHL